MSLMVYPFHLYNSGSRRDVIKLMVYLFHLHNFGCCRDVNFGCCRDVDGLLFPSTLLWFTFSIYAIQTNDLKNPKFFSTSSLPSTSFLSEEG
jgi:hypothetical protein